jgi:alpha-glucosidase
MDNTQPEETMRDSIPFLYVLEARPFAYPLEWGNCKSPSCGNKFSLMVEDDLPKSDASFRHKDAMSRRGFLAASSGVLIGLGAAAYGIDDAFFSNPPIQNEMAVGSFTIRLVPLGPHGRPLPGKYSIQITHRATGDLQLLTTAQDGNFLWATGGPVDARDESGGSFYVTAKRLVAATQTKITSASLDSKGALLKGMLFPEQGSPSRAVPVGFIVRIEEAAKAQLRLVFELSKPGKHLYQRVSIRLASDPDEAFFGFGEQLTYLNLKGQLVPLISQEHGIGRGMPLITQLVDKVEPGAGGTPLATETASTFFMTSTGKAMLVEGTSYMEADLREPAVARLDKYEPRASLLVFAGVNPLERLEVASSYIGRFDPLPDWVHDGVILGQEGGGNAVLDAIGQARANDIPLAGVWIQDWCGERISDVGVQVWWNWQLDKTLYPNWDQIVAEMDKTGSKVLTYINPYLSAVPGHDSLYQEAQQNGYLVLNEDDTPYHIPNTDIPVGVVDLSNPAARKWLGGVINSMIKSTRATGWMADFGEGLPMSGVRIHAGDPAVFHNRYPEEWAKLNREVVDSQQDPATFLPFLRSGFTRSPRYMTLGWLGDQLQTWNHYDGMKTAVTGMITGGLSGFSFLHSDIGGYLSLPSPTGGRVFTRTPQLLMRWMELGALSPVMRTHPGLAPTQNLQWNSTPQLIGQLKRCVYIYRSWSRYRRELVNKASKRGLPMIRALFLHYPEDPETFDLPYQYMIGSELMAAPVLEPDSDSVRVYLPKGRWLNLFTGDLYGSTAKGGYYVIPAPIGQPAFLGKQGSTVTEEVSSNLAYLKSS